MNPQFPRTMVAGKSLSRMVIGSNWIIGFSHTSAAADSFIKHVHSDAETTAKLLETYLSFGVDTMLAHLSTHETLRKAVALAEDRTGKKVIIIDSPILNVDDNASARKEAEATIKACAEAGTTFCFPHHMCAEQLVNKNMQTMDRLPDYLQMIRDHGMIPGLSAHMPELIIYSDLNEYDVQTYIQIYNCMGFMMQVEIEYIHKVIWNAKKPVLTIKPMAAGRCSPFVGLTFSFNTIRPQDMVAVGAHTAEEAAEDIEIAMAAIERRPPDLEGRSSPAKTSIMQ